MSENTNHSADEGHPTSSEQPSEKPVEVKDVPQNIFFEYEVVTEHGSPADINSAEELIPVLSHNTKHTNQILDGNVEAERSDTAAARRWKSTAEGSFDSVAVGRQFEETLAREGSEFRQYLASEKGKISYASPKFGEAGVAKVTGEKAQLRVRALLGLGGILTIPLWHSGFHITIKTPSESALIELRRRIIEDKISLGRHTHGLAFSNVGSYITSWILNFILDHVYDTTLKDSRDLASKIKTPDLPILFWGLACSVWPKGFQYARSLMTEEGITNKQIVTGRINVGKLMWVDNTAFTKFQKAHMSNRMAGSMTEESIQRYQEDFVLFKGRSIEINEQLKINLKTPNAAEYILSGQQWVASLSQIVEQTFTDERDDVDNRNRAITEHANATLMRHYGHWVENIDVEGSIQADRETIDNILETLSEDTDTRKKFHEQVGKYIDDVTVALIAIPEVTQKGTGIERFPNLIPLDVISVFFTLLMQRVALILNR